MKIEIEVLVDAPKHDVWQVITDIENATRTVSGIEKIEILKKPESGLVGLKWRETRTLFGKTAVETMWITEAVEDDHYLTEARSHGSLYRTKVFVAEKDGQTRLGMEFGARAETLVAKILSLLVVPFFKGATEKALLQDLEDLKKAAESR